MLVMKMIQRLLHPEKLHPVNGGGLGEMAPFA